MIKHKRHQQGNISPVSTTHSMSINKISHNQDGSVGMVVALVLSVTLLIGALGFGVWAFMGREDYKTNVDSKIATAVVVAKKEEGSKKDKEFAEAEKNPYRTYIGPQAYGSLNIVYPKTWSGVVDDTSTNSQALIDGFFAPSIVPSITNQNSAFALRVKVIGQSYATTLESLKSLQSNKDRPATVVPYALPKLPGVVGVQVTGYLPSQKAGVMIVLPLRSQTLEIWTEGTTYVNDFNNIILPNFTFSP